MKSFDVDVIFASPKTILGAVGAWPAQFPSIWYRLNTLFTFVVTFVLTVLCTWQGIIDFRAGDMENGCFAMCMVIAAGHAAFKVWFLQRKLPLILKIVECLKDPALASHEDHFDEYVQNKLIISRRIRLFILISCMATLTSVAITDIFDDPTTTSVLLPIRATIDDFPKYCAITVFTVVAHLQTGWVIASLEGLIFTLVSMGSAQLKILTHQITYSLEDVTSRDVSPKELQERDVVVNEKLKNCVLRHNAIERYVEAVEETFTIELLVQMLLTLVVTGLIGFCIMFASKNSLNFYKCILFFVADMSQVAIVCVSCNEIIFQSEYVRDACYMSNWTNCGPDVAKTLFVMMERSKRPFGFTAGKFTTISLQTLIALLRTSMSYFTVLRSMYLDS